MGVAVGVELLDGLGQPLDGQLQRRGLLITLTSCAALNAAVCKKVATNYQLLRGSIYLERIKAQLLYYKRVLFNHSPITHNNT